MSKLDVEDDDGDGAVEWRRVSGLLLSPTCPHAERRLTPSLETGVYHTIPYHNTRYGTLERRLTPSPLFLVSRYQVTLQMQTGSYHQTQKIGSDLSGVCTCKRRHTCDFDKKWLAWISIWRWRWIQIWIGVESIDQHSNIDITWKVSWILIWMAYDKTH